VPRPGRRRPPCLVARAARPDHVLEIPQSGERIRGRDNMRAFQQAYPNPPTAQPRRVVGAGEVWVVEGRADYGGRISHVANIVEFRDSKIWRETRCYAEPFQTPAWRRNGPSTWTSRLRRARPHPWRETSTYARWRSEPLEHVGRTSPSLRVTSRR
jgi:hypothetical protein